MDPTKLLTMLMVDYNFSDNLRVLSSFFNFKFHRMFKLKSSTIRHFLSLDIFNSSFLKLFPK